MATKNVTTQKPVNPLLDEEATVSACNAAYAISQIAALLSDAQLHGGFEGINEEYENALNIAIKVLGEHVGQFTGAHLEEIDKSQEAAA